MTLNKEIESQDVTETISNVYETELTWIIDHFHGDKHYFTNIALPCGIECTLTLIPTCIQPYHNHSKEKKEYYRFTYVQPILFINKINEAGNYNLKFSIKALAKARGIMAISSYQEAIVRTDGYKMKGFFITSSNIGQVRNNEGTITLKLKFVLKELDNSQPFDREDYTIERNTLSKDFTKLFMSEKHSDVALILGDDKIYAHKIILLAQSGTFAKIMKDDDKIREIIIQMRYAKEVYIELFRFIYNNTIKDLKNNLEALLSLANEYEVEGLKRLCHCEIASFVINEFSKLTKSQRQVPSHIIMDLEKTKQFSQMLIEMKNLMKKPIQSTEAANTFKTPSIPAAAVHINPKIEETILVMTKNNDIREPAVDFFTESMTDLMTKTLSPENYEEPNENAKDAKIIQEMKNEDVSSNEEVIIEEEMKHDNDETYTVELDVVDETTENSKANDEEKDNKEEVIHDEIESSKKEDYADGDAEPMKFVANEEFVALKLYVVDEVSENEEAEEEEEEITANDKAEDVLKTEKLEE